MFTGLLHKLYNGMAVQPQSGGNSVAQSGMAQGHAFPAPHLASPMIPPAVPVRQASFAAPFQTVFQGSQAFSPGATPQPLVLGDLHAIVRDTHTHVRVDGGSTWPCAHMPVTFSPPPSTLRSPRRRVAASLASCVHETLSW